PTRSWWFTPGGGVHAGESQRAAAARELCEETGYSVPPEALTGPLWERTALFDFMTRPYVQHEVFYVARVADATGRSEVAFTDDEVVTLDAAEWFTPAQVRAIDGEVFPTVLGELLDTVTAWDGVTRDLGRE